jgi:hypothetical protein
MTEEDLNHGIAHMSAIVEAFLCLVLRVRPCLRPNARAKEKTQKSNKKTRSPPLGSAQGRAVLIFVFVVQPKTPSFKSAFLSSPLAHSPRGSAVNASPFARTVILVFGYHCSPLTEMHAA